jgi:hypothetical protein
MEELKQQPKDLDAEKRATIAAARQNTLALARAVYDMQEARKTTHKLKVKKQRRAQNKRARASRKTNR